MRRTLATTVLTLALALVFTLGIDAARAAESTPQGGSPVVILETSLGNIELTLDAEKAPISAENFLAYVDAGHYDGTIFHRVISGFMIQGGGFDASMSQKATKGPIKNEFGNGLTNQRGTIAMARTNDPHSATSQFFINTVDNAMLNNPPGYAVFGKVTAGMDVVDKIEKVETTSKGGHRDVPAQPITITKARRK